MNKHGGWSYPQVKKPTSKITLYNTHFITYIKTLILGDTYANIFIKVDVQNKILHTVVKVLDFRGIDSEIIS